MLRVFLMLLLYTNLGAEDPWGKDAPPPPKAPPIISSSPCLYLIYFHQQFLSEADGPRSHFVPSSSEYMRRAIVLWGSGTGFLLGCDRLLRENSDEWVYGKIRLSNGFRKWDPVPKPSS
jgi:putative component of membrane protein insertase Oxa1/YidC/SpoIIIJ protein YidD